MGWKERLEAKAAELAAAEAAITGEDAAEIANREAEAALDAKIGEARAKKRTLDMQRAVDAWRDKLGAGGKRAYVDGLQVEGRDDFFVIAANKGAQESLTARVNHRQTKPSDLPRIYLDYALLVVKVWHDGKTEHDTSSSQSMGSVELRRFLEDNPGVVATIATTAGRLAGAHAVDFKS